MSPSFCLPISLRIAAGILWASPLSLLGLLLALPILCLRGRMSLVPVLRGRHVSRQPPALLVRGRIADYLLAHHPFGAMQAMAIGHIIIADQRAVSQRLLVHEMVHVMQAAKWGPLFPFVYLAASAWARLRGGNAYWDNVYEVAARQAERNA